MDPCWLSKPMSGDLQPAGLSIKQCSLFEPRGRRFKPSSTDKVVVTSVLHLLTDTGETKANVSRKANFFKRTNLIKDATVVSVSSMRLFPPFLYRVSLSLELVFRIIYLWAKKSSWTESFYYMMAQSLRMKVKGKQGNELSSQ